MEGATLDADGAEHAALAAGSAMSRRVPGRTARPATAQQRQSPGDQQCGQDAARK